MARGKILLVEDEPVVRRTIASLLEELGFAVIEADTAETALVALVSADVDVLLSDDGLGTGISGASLIAGSAAVMPATVVLMSGNPEPADLAKGTRYLSKPFTIAQLEAAVHPSGAV